MQDFAATYTQGAGSGTTNVAPSEQSIYVYGIVMSNTGTSTASITFNTTESSVTKMIEITFASRETVIIDIPFLADKGFQWVGGGTAPEDIEITVFHSNVGA